MFLTRFLSYIENHKNNELSNKLFINGDNAFE